jgi:RNA polymerase subunit RPABC4/transcription elongation factor Spt4
MVSKHLFEDYRACEICRRPLPEDYAENICPACKEMTLFHEVKEYIRANDVTEYDVADHFDIPLSLVKKWIKEGRIEYREEYTPTIKSTYCQKCGAPVTFGTLCPKCLKAINASGHGTVAAAKDKESTKMRFLENP